MFVMIDIKYAFRLLMKTPRFSILTLLVLVGSLSISLFTFSFLHTMVYKDLPIPEAESAKVVNVFYDGRYKNIRGFEYTTVKQNSNSLAEFGVYYDSTIRLSNDDAGRDLNGTYVQAGFFEFSRTQPILGRVFQSQDSQVGATPVAVISHKLWQSEYNRDPGILGQHAVFNGTTTEIIGIMPEDYRFPVNANVWLPLSEQVFNVVAEQSGVYRAYGRLKPGISTVQAEGELGQLVNQVYQQHVTLYDFPELDKSVKLTSFQEAQTGGEGTPIFTFLNIISWLILMLACINVGNLLLARSIERHKETAIRAALGASTRRLVSQLMWEGIIISLTGGVLSLLLVGAALDYTQIAFHSWNGGVSPFWWRWGMDAATLSMALVFTLATIFLTAFLPAWRSSRQDINETLRDGTRGAQSKRAGKLSRMLVSCQVFLVAILILIGSVTAMISHEMINIETGDDYTDVMNARLQIPEHKYAEPKQQIGLIQGLQQRIEQNPNVTGVVSSSWFFEQSKVRVLNQQDVSESTHSMMDTMAVIGDTSTIGINVVAGRALDNRDSLSSRKTVLISQSMANRYWPGESVLEKTIEIEIDGSFERFYIVGVVTNRINIRKMFSPLDSADEIYVSGLQVISPLHFLYYRTVPGTAYADEIFYQALFDVDRSVEMTDPVEPADRNRNKLREMMQLVALVTYGTGAFALLLAIVGIFGITANAVAHRTHEIGIRRAVGASDKNIILMFLKQGARQLYTGVGLALVLFALVSFGFHRFTEALFPISLYFVIITPVVIGLTIVVGLAILAPVRRAVEMEPSTALRYE